MTNGFRQRMGQQPLPTSGTISREQYKTEFAQRMAAFQPGGAGATPGATPGASFQMSTTPGQVTLTPQPGAPQWSGGQFGGGGGQGFNPSAMTDEQIQGMMRRYDVDGDGKISRQEAQRSDRLIAAFDQYDTNRDGYIDLNEYKAYMTARMTERTNGNGGPGGGRGSFGQNGSQFPGGGQGFSPMANSPGMDPNQQWGGGQWGGGGFDPTSRGDRGDRWNRDQKNEDERPVVYRYGKLPKELPGWFTSLDEDKDGQIGLHEWRKDGRATAEFVAMDLNGDGFVTAEEYLRYRKLKDVADKDDSDDESPNAGRGNRASSGGDRGNADRGSGDRGSSGNRTGSPQGGRSRSNDASKEYDKEDGGGKSRDKGERKGNKGGSGGSNPFKGG